MHRHRHERRKHDWSRHFGGGEPWGWRQRFFEPGEVRLALLSLLDEQPMHGYQLMKAMEERSGGTYRASAGTIYPNLQQLEDEGLVTSRREGGRRVYSLTEEGRRVVRQEQATINRIWERADNWDDWAEMFVPTAAEMLGPMSRLIKAVVTASSRARNDREQVEHIRTILNRAIDDIEAAGRM